MHAEAGQFFMHNYSPDEYGAHLQNWAIAQGPRGRMYFGNTSGVLTFDGVHWQLTPVSNGSVVRSLAVGEGGRVYVGAQKELGYLAPDSVGQLQYVSLVEHVPPKLRQFTEVWKTFATPEGVYFQTPEYLFLWSEKQERMTAWPAEAAFHLSFEVRGDVYVREWGRGLLRLEDDSLRLVPGGERFADERVYVMLPYDADRILVGTRTQGLFLYDGRAFTRFRTEADSFLLENQLYQGAVLPDGAFALTTMRGGVALVRPSGELFRVLSKANGLQDETVLAVGAGPQGGMWLGLNKGITRVGVPAPLSFYDERVGLQGVVQSVTRHRGKLYAATYRGVYRLETSAAEDRQPVFEPVPGLATRCWSLLSTERGLLAGCTDGVHRIGQRGAARITEQAATALHRPRRDSALVLVGLHDGLGLLHLRNGRWTEAEEHVAGVSGEVRSIAETRSGTVWLGTGYTGAFRIDVPEGASSEDSGKTLAVEHFETARHGLPEGSVYVFSAGGRVFFATKKGLLRHTSASGTPFAPDSAFGGGFARGPQTIFRAAEARNGSLWMRTSAGTGVARRREDGSYAWEPAPLLHVLLAEGVYAIYPEPGGVVWIGDAERLVRHGPPAAEGHAAGFAASVRRVTVGADSLIYGGDPPIRARTPELAYKDNALRFAYAAPSYGLPSATQYQYRLGGFDERWSAWTKETRKDYTNLPPGNYAFRVRAKNALGQTSRAGLFAFRILPPWYLTRWAQLAYGLVVLGAVAGISFAYNGYRTRRLKRYAREMRRRVTERTAALRQQARTLERANRQLQRADEQKSEFLGTIAHDLKNPLSGIIGTAKLLLEEAGDGQAPGGLAQEFLPLIRDDAERMLRIIDELLNAQVLESGKVELHRQPVNLADLARSVMGRNQARAEEKFIALRFEGPEDCRHLVDETHLQRAMDNLVSNAIKYSPAGCAVEVRLTCEAACIRFSVADEGPGLTEEDKEKVFGKLERLSARPTGGEHSTGLGLYIVKTIIEQHGGTVGVESTHGEGATFYAELPLVGEAPEADGAPLRHRLAAGQV